MFENLFVAKKYRDIDPQDVKERLDADENLFLVDVRSPEEYEEYHIPNSISIPLNVLKTEIAKAAPDKDAEIIVYCLSGRRAAAACGMLAEMGYRSVSNMGGILSWRYQTVRGR
ncbi:MAG TPA: rhodanese-like domain-containing protein [Caproiciproducens sp.]|jgi:Rhodanese-related sulfurtransferase|nr:rhodanese-like domain-containing protein [Caproiciproducens sp.]